MDANMLIGVAAVIGAVTGLINSVIAAATLAQGRSNGAIGAETKTVVDRVEVNSNGHTAALTEMARSVDPAIAALAAAEVIATAKAVAETKGTPLASPPPGAT